MISRLYVDMCLRTIQQWVRPNGLVGETEDRGKQVIVSWSKGDFLLHKMDTIEIWAKKRHVTKVGMNES